MSRLSSLLCLVCLGLVVSSCEDTSVNAPIGEPEMQALLLDLYLVEKGLGLQYPKSVEKRDSAAGILYAKTLAYHKTDTAEFRKSYLAYMQRPDALKEMHLAILGDLAYMEAILGGKKPARGRNPQPESDNWPSSIAPKTPEEQQKQREAILKAIHEKEKQQREQAK